MIYTCSFSCVFFRAISCSFSYHIFFLFPFLRLACVHWDRSKPTFPSPVGEPTSAISFILSMSRHNFHPCIYIPLEAEVLWILFSRSWWKSSFLQALIPLVLFLLEHLFQIPGWPNLKTTYLILYSFYFLSHFLINDLNLWTPWKKRSLLKAKSSTVLSICSMTFSNPFIIKRASSMLIILSFVAIYYSTPIARTTSLSIRLCCWI